MLVMKNNQGFTLIEIIVAIAVTAVIGSIAAASISSAAKNKETFDLNVQELNAVESFWQLLATDLNHVTNQRLPSVSAGVGSAQRPPSFMGGDPQSGESNFLLGDYFLRFSRDGWANPLNQQRSDLQRVGYRFIDGNLWREYWPERNQPFDGDPSGRRLLIGCIDVVETVEGEVCKNRLNQKIKGIAIRFLPYNADKVVNGPWQNAWPPQDPQFQQKAWQLPTAVEVTLSLDSFGDVQRLFPLPGI